MSFLSELVLLRERDSWIIREPLVYHSAHLGRDVVVPVGFETDFASIPRFFHRLLPKNGEYDAAAVVHDFLYSTGEVAKADADIVFYEAMTVMEVPAWKRQSMYWAVKCFGFMAWNAHRKARG